MRPYTKDELILISLALHNYKFTFEKLNNSFKSDSLKDSIEHTIKETDNLLDKVKINIKNCIPTQKVNLYYYSKNDNEWLLTMTAPIRQGLIPLSFTEELQRCTAYGLNAKIMIMDI